MNYKELSDEYLIALAKLRLLNENLEVLPTKITIDSKKNSGIFTVSFMFETKELGNYRFSILFKKFYPNEVLYLQKVGVKF